MQKDIELFRSCETGEAGPFLRIFSWQPRCISLGYSQEIEEEIDLARAEEMGWDVVRRPTGGGIVFHNEAEVTYSLVIGKDKLPAGLVPSFEKITEAVIVGLKKIGIEGQFQTSNLKPQNRSQISNSKSQLCFSYPEGYEIVVGGKKLVGAAQKRGKKALLQQGSIYVKPIEKAAYQILRRPFEVPDAMSIQELLGRVPSFDELSQALIEGFREGLGFEI